MLFQIGDKVIHSSFGFAEIVGIESKSISGSSQQYYVVKTNEMLVWVPTSEASSSKIRFPSSKTELTDCFAILKSKYSPFSTDRNLRKSSIREKVNLGNLKLLCEVIRDLSFYKMQNKINDSEKSILEKAIIVLIDEWAYVFDIKNSQARSELTKLLNESSACSN
jgi:CarD family transcriptional regulator